MKKCSSCKIEKNIDDFYKNRTMKDGYSGCCKVCHKISLKKTIDKDHQRRLNNQKRYRENNREKLRLDSKTYLQENYDARLAVQRKYYHENKEKRRAHHLVSMNIRLGKIIRVNNCEICNSDRKIEAHHEDYSKPLEIKWLCKLCHENVHHVIKD